MKSGECWGCHQYKQNITRDGICLDCLKEFYACVDNLEYKGEKPKKTTKPTEGYQPFGNCNHSYGKNALGRCANCDAMFDEPIIEAPTLFIDDLLDVLRKHGYKTTGMQRLDIQCNVDRIHRVNIEYFQSDT
jgi:hypothetical protein